VATGGRHAGRRPRPIVGYVYVKCVRLDPNRDAGTGGSAVAHHVRQRLLNDPEAGLLDGDRNRVAVQVHVCVGIEAGGLGMVEELSDRCEVEGWRGRRRVLGFAQEAQRRAQVVESFGRNGHDVSQDAVRVLAGVEVRSDACADVDRHEGVRDRIVEIARHSKALVGNATAALLFTLVGDPQVPLPMRLAQFAPGPDGVTNHERAQRNPESDSRIARDVVGGDDHDHRDEEDCGAGPDNQRATPIAEACHVVEGDRENEDGCVIRLEDRQAHEQPGRGAEQRRQGRLAAPSERQASKER
jgi:hypothetical protein